MLENTNIWTHGSMDLYIDNKPAHVYIPETNVKKAYDNLQSRLSEEGSIPIGIDHLPDDIIKANPILAKLNLLNVGNITQIEYANDAIKIVEAELTNPLIKQLYDAGELDMVSIVANSTTSECPADYDYIIDNTDITRVDLVEKGACTVCNIPKPTASDTVVYARYAIQTEEKKMPEDLTIESIKEALKEEIAPFDARLDAMEAKIANLEKQDTNPSDDTEIAAMKAELDELKKQNENNQKEAIISAANAKVELGIQAGKILPAQKESMVEIAARNPEQFDEFIKNQPVMVDVNTKKSLVAGFSADDDDGKPTPEEENLNRVVAHFSGDD